MIRASWRNLDLRLLKSNIFQAKKITQGYLIKFYGSIITTNTTQILK